MYRGERSQESPNKRASESRPEVGLNEHHPFQSDRFLTEEQRARQEAESMKTQKNLGVVKEDEDGPEN